MRILSVLFMLFIAMAGPSAGDERTIKDQNGPAKFAPSRSLAIQNDLEVLSGVAGDIYDLAKLNKWNRARKKFDELIKAEKSLKLSRNEENDFLSQRLRARIEDLDRAITARERRETMRFANNITYLEVAMVAQLKPRVPTNVMLLDYCGRELEILSEEKNMDKLSNLVVRMHLIWQNLMPQLIDKGDTKELKKFSEIMKRLEVAKSPEEYGSLARQVLDEVDNLEKVFKK